MNKLDKLFIEESLLIKRGSEAHKDMLPKSRILEEAPINAKKAAVILLIYPKSNILHTVFIQRTVYNGAHSGQISFPGGMAECDDENLQATAIRETFEEIGVALSPKNIIGKLSPLYITVSKIKVYPFVAYAEGCCIFNINNYEVMHSIETPIETFLNQENRLEGLISAHNTEISAPYYAVGEKKIWGATAMILAEFIDCLKRHSSKEKGL
jgi:8-oxo-dGTP pyrophosphatase MutT (NUDIX family)